MGKRSSRLVGAVCCVLALGTIPAAAQSNAEPYAGKQVRMIIGFGYDNAQLAEVRHPC